MRILSGWVYDCCMLWTVHKTALFLGLKEHQVYYLLVMGFIEGVKINKLWRVVSDDVRNYRDKRTA